MEQSNYPSFIGNRATAAVLAAFIQADFTTLLPFGDGHPYDLVVDTGRKLVRVQCKNGRVIKGSVVSARLHTTSRKSGKSYFGLADVFAIYCAKLDKIYLIPVTKNLENISLRLSETRNKQKKAINWARDYEFYPELIIKIADSLPLK
jgi:hypothetical protein